MESHDPVLSAPTVGDTSFFRKPKMATGRSRKKDIPEGLWTRCPKCSSMIFDRELDENLKVCPRCRHHFPIGARERVHALVETCSFQEMDADLVSVDVLEFGGGTTYAPKLEKNRAATGLNDAVVTGIGLMGTWRVALGVMDFSFLGGSMGSVVGEKLTRLIEAGTDRGLPVVIISTSGGARMYEGMFSLMQMAKTSGALAYHAAARLPYISVLTHPTTAGGDGELCQSGGSDFGRTGGDDRFCGAPGDQGHHPGRVAARFPDGGVFDRARIHRRDCAAGRVERPVDF